MAIYNNKKLKNLIKKIIAFNNIEFEKALIEIEKEKNNGYYLLGYIRYDAKNVFLNKEIKSEYPILYFEVYETYEKDNAEAINNDLKIYNESEITYEEYKIAIKTIKLNISEGNTYEVNYTYPYKVYTDNTIEELYYLLQKKQKTPYNTLIQNKFETLLSFSPELFFRIKDNKIITKPMKGTIKRGLTKKEDIENYNFLKNDTKNRAENIMIVDLLRNDLSKIAKTGSVKVEKLFEIEKHPTLFQMTSEITAELKEEITLYDILKAIFPCGSITGAPKISTMHLIDNIEEYNREIYCGAIAYITKNETIFSVPIRILQKKNNDNFYKYFVGGAIVWDSCTEDEWNETLTKKKIIDFDIKYNLIETMLCKDNSIVLFDYHKNRLINSAKKLNFKFNEQDFNFEYIENTIIRCELSPNGVIKKEFKKLEKIQSNKISLAKHAINSNNPFLKDKTTFRPWYKIDLKNRFDIIFYNEKKELTEGTRTNIVLQLNGKLYTPPVNCGLLNGTYRQYLLDNKKINEKTLYIDDLAKAEKIFCINSVRGMVEVYYDNN